MVNSLITTAKVEALHVALKRAGWEVQELRIGESSARIVVRSMQHRVILDVSQTQGTMTTEYKREYHVSAGQDGAMFPTQRFDFQLLGRQRIPGGLASLRALASYLADNAPRQLTRGDARRAMAFLTHTVRA